MSHLIAPSHTVVDSIPLGRRIYEIAKEKGSAFTITAMANRLNMSRETLRLMIKGEREIYTFELENISALLKVSVERILQEDIREKVSEFRKLIDDKLDLDKAIQIGTEISVIADGITEKGNSLYQLARAFLFIDNKDAAHNYLQESFLYAQQIAEKLDDHELLYNILTKLMLTCAAKQDYTQLANILDLVEPFFASNHHRQGVVYYAKAMIAIRFNNVDMARENLYKSRNSFILAGGKNDIGRAANNVGYFEFLQKNYNVAKGYLEEAIEHLNDDIHTKLLAIKEYAKVLIKLEQKDKSIKLLKTNLSYTEEYPVLKGKYNLLLSIAKNDASYAESIFSIPEVGNKVLRLVCRYLTKYYIILGDSEAVLKYAMLEERYLSESKEIIDEEDF